MARNTLRTVIENCRVVTPGRPIAPAAIAMRGGVIERVLAAKEARGAADRVMAGEAWTAADHTYDAGGCMALPGFIDIHVHGAAGADICDGTVAAVEAVARAKLAEGVTTFCPTTLSLPEARIAAALQAVAAYMRNPTAAKVPGVHLEGPFLNPVRCGAQNPAHIRPPDLDEVRRHHAIAPLAIVTCAVEMPGGVDFVRGLAAMGIVPSCSHSSATYAEFCAARQAGLAHLAHFCNAMSGLDRRELGLVGAGLLDDGALVELICDRVHVAPELIALIFKVKPLERIALVTDAIHASGLPDGKYALGGVDIVLEGAIAKVAGIGGVLAGSTLRFNRGLKNVFEITGRPLEKLVRTTALNQARALSLKRTGAIRRGWKADVAILDDDFEVRAVFVDGEQRFGTE